MVKKLIYILIVLLAFVAGAVVGVSLNPANLNRIPTVEAVKAEAPAAKDTAVKETTTPAAVTSDNTKSTLVGKWQSADGTKKSVLEFFADGSGKDHLIVGSADSVRTFNWGIIDSTHVSFDYSNSLEIVTMALSQSSLSLTYADGQVNEYQKSE